MDGLKKAFIALIAAAGMLTCLMAPAMAANLDLKIKTTTDMTIADVAMSDPKFSTLVTAVKAAGMTDALKGAGEITVFAPTDAAFERLPSATLTKAMNDKDMLKGILTYHVVPGKYTAADLMKMNKVTALDGKELLITMKDGKVHVGGAVVTQADIKANNGIVHAIDRVLMPPS